MPKKLKGGTLWDFSTSILSQNSEKIEAGPFGEFFLEKKSHNAEKKLERDPFVQPGVLCYSNNKEKPFSFCLLRQMVQFDTIKFCRTILVTSDVSKKNTDEKP